MRNRFGLFVATLSVMLISGVSLPAPVTAAPISEVSNVAVVSSADRLKTSWSWYVTRASGMVAAGLLAVLVVSGVGLLTGLTYRVFEPLPAWVLHRAVGLSFGLMVIIHMTVLLFDKFVGFSLADILVPFATTYKPVMFGGVNFGSFAMALGILSLYAIVAVIVSSLVWMQAKPKAWRWLHYLSYAILVMVFIHSLLLGTDLKHGVWRWLWLLGGILLLTSIATRLRRARTIGGKA
jgi:predicted ferric reductase